MSIKPLAQDSKSSMLPLPQVDTYYLGDLWTSVHAPLGFWTLDHLDLVTINRAWLYKDPGAVVQYSLGVIFCYWNFLFSCNKAFYANIGIIANFVYFVNTPSGEK